MESGSKERWVALTGVGFILILVAGFIVAGDEPPEAKDGGQEFQVRVTYRGHSVVLPVWDVGPWNTHDEYWAPNRRYGDVPTASDFDASYDRLRARGVEFVSAPRSEPYGRVAVFLDIAGNRWDLIGRDPA